MSLHSSSDRLRTIATLIDHTALKPELDETIIGELCREAVQFGFASVCVNPFWVRACASELVTSSIRVCSVVGFPLGAHPSSVKKVEAVWALEAGAAELDVVQNVGALRSGFHAAVEEELKDLASLAHANGAILKVILETCLLTNEEKRIAAELAVQAGADFVKTSTGFSTGGATVADTALLRQTVGPRVGVKASGGIKTLTTLQAMVEAGATRIGTSSGVAIMQEAQSPNADEVMAKQCGSHHGSEY